MKLSLVLCIVVCFVTLCESRNTEKKTRKNGRHCSKERCRAGRKCATRYDGEEVCICRENCKSREHLICGSDGKTHTNYCHLHRSACLDNKHVTVLHEGPCLIEFGELINEEERKAAVQQQPLVCYQVQRDQLRQLLVDWIKSQVTEGKSYDDIKSYDDVLSEMFTSCDVDHDSYLDGDELLKCTEKNPSETESNLHILRGLCMDALINMGDEDNNWTLNQPELTKILGMSYIPPTKECQLEDKVYQDGAETKLDCNVCVCACGNWVCTGAPCFKGKEMGVPGPVVDGHIPGQKETEELLKGFQAVNKVKLTDVESEVKDLVKDSDIKDDIIEELKDMSKKINANM